MDFQIFKWILDGFSMVFQWIPNGVVIVFWRFLDFDVFLLSFSGAFWEVFVGIWGVSFDHFSLLFSIKKLVDFSTDFSWMF